MRRAGLGDALGIVVALTALMYVPMWIDPASFPKLLVLVAGAGAVMPFVLIRWVGPDRPQGWRLLPCGAAAALVLWVGLATLASDAPMATRLFGWFLRADGLLGSIAALVLLLGAATLRGEEVRRALGWIVAGAGVAAVFAIPQIAGVPFMVGDDGSVSATFGQTNFSGAYFAMCAVLALGLALSVTGRAWRIANLVGALAFTALAFLSDALQGPMALGAGLVMVGLAWVLGHRGRHRTVAVAGSVIVLAVGLTVALLGMLSIGPLGFVGREGNTQWRYNIWSQGWDLLAAHPFLGVGTGSFARYLSEYRSLESTLFVGESMRPSAVHSIPLQFGIIGGWPALVLWCVLFGSALALLLIRIVRAPMPQRLLAAGVVGALSAYLAQAVVSIDVPSILAIGWLLAGLAVALAADPVPGPKNVPTPRKSKARTADPPPTPARTLIRAFVASAVLVLVGGWAVLSQVQAVERARDLTTAESVAAVATDPMVPCPVRLQVARDSLVGQPFTFVIPTLTQALAVDPRCPPMVNLLSVAALESGALDLASTATQSGVELDPQSVTAWELRQQYFERMNDSAGAQDARARADAIKEAAAARAG
jgi:O-antigen ligase